MGAMMKGKRAQSTKVITQFARPYGYTYMNYKGELHLWHYEMYGADERSEAYEAFLARKNHSTIPLRQAEFVDLNELFSRAGFFAPISKKP